MAAQAAIGPGSKRSASASNSLRVRNGYEKVATSFRT